MTGKISKRSYPVALNSSELVIAMAQLEGPLPSGKQRTVVGEREIYQWRSLSEMNRRISKACDILDSLNRLSRKPDIVIFPDYSLPIERALPQLQAKADKYKQIVIGGGDTFLNPRTTKIVCQAPIIIPGRKETIWLKKRNLSQWEYGYVDQPNRVELPVLTWEVDGSSYWLSIYLSLDFLLAPAEKPKGSGIVMVPLCSPEINTFLTYAATLLRDDGGTVTVLCNCVGEDLAGRSSVCALLAGSNPLKPAIELPEDKEAVVVFEIDCSRIASSRITPALQEPLGKRQLFSLLTTPDSCELIPAGSTTAYGKAQVTGVVNPAVFDLLGKRMRIAFLQIDKYQETAQRVKDADFEVLAVLGQHDLIVTHLHENRYDMIFDITQTLPVKSDFGARDVVAREDFPFFGVDVFFKVLGFQIGSEERAIFDGPEKTIPTLQQLTQLFRLGSNWEDEEVTSEDRDLFLRRKWILGSTTAAPGEIDGVMSIYLDHASGGDITALHADFEDRVLKEIAKERSVTSIYRGRSRNLSIHYLLRISAEREALFSLIDEVHKLASEARILVKTTTYVVVTKMANLSLEKAILLPVLPIADANFRNQHLLPKLTDEDRVRAIYLPQDEQRTLIQHYRMVLEVLKPLGGKSWLQRRLARTEETLARGLIHKDFTELKELHDLLQLQVEKLLRQFLEERVAQDQLERWSAELNIQRGKVRSALTYTEKMKLVIRVLEEQGISGDLLSGARALLQTVQVRNAFAHGDESNLTMDTYVEAILGYANFLLQWDKNHLIGYKASDGIETVV